MNAPTPIAQAALKAILYADVFAFPLQDNELYQRLVWETNTSPIISFQDLKSTYQELSSYCHHQEGYWYLKSRSHTIKHRNQNRPHVLKKLSSGTQVAKFISKIPTVQSVLITGSVAAQNAHQQDDIDLLVITSPGTLWSTRLQVISLVELFYRRRHPNQDQAQDAICLNMFLDSNSLAVPVHKRNLFTAHEVILAQPMFSNNGTYRKFLQQNQWVQNFLPNAWQLRLSQSHFPQSPTHHLLIKSNQLLEPTLRNLQQKYMQKRRTVELITPTSAYFHPRDHAARILTEYHQRLIRYNLQ